MTRACVLNYSHPFYVSDNVRSRHFAARLQVSKVGNHRPTHGCGNKRWVLVSGESGMTTECSTLSNHGIPLKDVQAAFENSARFFALSDAVKAKTSLNGKNAGWEKNAQIRPSTGTADQKESMQLQFARMEGMWPSEEDIPEFQAQAEHFMKQVQG